VTKRSFSERKFDPIFLWAIAAAAWIEGHETGSIPTDTSVLVLLAL